MTGPRSRSGITRRRRPINVSSQTPVDWFSRRVLAWKLSITLETEFCLDAVNEALARHDKPGIFNADQGSQFTSVAFTGLLPKQM